MALIKILYVICLSLAACIFLIFCTAVLFLLDVI